MATYKISKAMLAEMQTGQDDLQECAGKVAALVESLRSVHDDLKDKFDGASERWQESERGESTSTWLENLDTLISDLDDLEGTMKEQADAIGDLTPEPEY
jgi:uncharacterized protein YukE